MIITEKIVRLVRGTKAKMLAAGLLPGQIGIIWDDTSKPRLAIGDKSNIPQEVVPPEHIHVISDVTGLQTALAAKASTAHASTHATGGTDALTPAAIGAVATGGALGTPSSGNLVNCTFPTLNQSTTGSAAKLTTARAISISGGATGTATSFDGSAAIAIPVTALAASYLTGTIPPAVLGKSTVYIGSTAIALNRATGSLALTGITSVDGTAAGLTTARTIALSGGATGTATSFNGTANISIPVTGLAASYLSGTIPSAVLGNSTVYVGTTAIALNRASATLALTGISSIDGTASGLTTARTIAISGGATGTATSFDGTANITVPITALGASYLTGTIPSAVLGNSSVYIGTTAIALNRASAALTLAGVSVGGNAATVTSITSAQVTTALGYTPYNATNPSSFIALSTAIAGYVVQASAALATTDTLLAALGKLEGNANSRALSTHTHDYSTVYAPLSHSHAWGDITGKPSTFTPPIATASVLGGVKIGSNITVDAAGVISVAAPYVHPTTDGNLHVPATSTTNAKKVVMAGSTAGSISWAFVDWADLINKPSTFAPPIATASVLGGVKIGTNVSVDAAGVISVPSAEAPLGNPSANSHLLASTTAGVRSWVAPYSHPTGDGNSHVPATSTTSNLKVLKAGTTANSAAWGNVAYSELTGIPSTFAPPIATASVLGGVIVSFGLAVDASGNLSVNLTSPGPIGGMTPGAGTFSTLTATAALRETRVALSSGAIDLSAGNAFSYTVAASTTFAFSNVPASGTVQAFILDLTNAGAYTITWPSSVKWASGSAPTLTAAGRDVLGFLTHDGGTTWSGFVLGKAMA